MWRLALLLVLAATPSMAAAAVVSPGPQSVALTLYHQGDVDTASLAQGSASRDGGFALVSETRELDLPAGPVEIQFRGVAGTMVPQTADLAGLPVKESNFDFDLLSPAALIAKSIGQSVHIRRTDPKTGAVIEETAVIESGPNGTVLRTPSGIEALDCSGLKESLVFDRLPDRLYDTPTLTMRADVRRAGHYKVTLRYIATGLNWSADYVARVHGGTLDLSGWITLANFSETSFAHAPVDVIAGHVETTGDDTPPALPADRKSDACWPTRINWATYAPVFAAFRTLAPAPPPAAAMMGMVQTVTVSGSRIEPRNLGDYKLYPLPEPTDVAAHETKQVQFLDNRAVPFRKLYRIAAGEDPNEMGGGKTLPAAIVLLLDNSERGHLGKPLPAGGVSAMTTAGGVALLMGHDRMQDVAVGLPVEIGAGDTMAVRAQARVLDSTLHGAGRNKFRRTTVEVAAVNTTTAAASFEWRQPMDETGSKLLSATSPHQAKDGALVWPLSLKPGERAVFRYTVDKPD